MADQQRMRGLVQRDTKLTLSLTELAIAQIVRLWRGFDDWYDGDLVLARSARSATLIEAAQRQSRLKTIAYLKQVYRELNLELPQTEPLQAPYPRRGVRIDEVWERPAEQYRYQKSVGKSDEAAVDAAVDRATTLADTDVSLARRDQSASIYRQTPRVIGYRRIIHPELSKSGTCGLCVVAADRTYSLETLLPIHNLCNCGTMPVTKDEDPGLSLNRRDLNRLYGAAGSTDAADLSQVRVKVNEHGELGPVLTKQGNEFTTESERQSTAGKRSGRSSSTKPAAKSEISRRQSIEAQIPALEASNANLRERAAAGEDVSTALKWQKDRLTTLRRELQQLGSAA